MKTSLLLLLPVAFTISALAPVAANALDFKKDIRPILNDKCFKCHSGPRAKGKLRMDTDTSFALRIGGDDPVVLPGKPGESLLAIKPGLPRNDEDTMPPPRERERGAEGLTTTELNLIKQWISEGASLEEGAAPAAVTSTDSGSGDMKKEVHTWTNSEGKELKASFGGVNGSDVLLVLEDGRTIPYAYDKLSPESKALAKKLATE